MEFHGSRAQEGHGRVSELSQTDRKFLNFAAQDNQAEIPLCLVAENRASNVAVRTFARLMVDDHAEIESRLAALGNDLKLSDDLPDGIGNDGKMTASKVMRLRGKQFELQLRACSVSCRRGR